MTWWGALVALRGLGLLALAAAVGFVAGVQATAARAARFYLGDSAALREAIRCTCEARTRSLEETPAAHARVREGDWVRSRELGHERGKVARMGVGCAWVRWAGADRDDFVPLPWLQRLDPTESVLSEVARGA